MEGAQPLKFRICSVVPALARLDNAGEDFKDFSVELYSGRK